MQTKLQMMQAFIRHCRDQTGKESIDMHDVAEAAMRAGWQAPKPKTPKALLAEKFSFAAREESRIDEVTGRPYRVNLAVTTWHGQGEQTTLWTDIDVASRPIAHRALMQRREQMVGDAVHISDDAAHWNRVNPDAEPIQVPLDFAPDVQWRQNAPGEDEQAA